MLLVGHLERLFTSRCYCCEVTGEALDVCAAVGEALDVHEAGDALGDDPAGGNVGTAGPAAGNALGDVLVPVFAQVHVGRGIQDVAVGRRIEDVAAATIDVRRDNRRPPRPSSW